MEVFMPNAKFLRVNVFPPFYVGFSGRKYGGTFHNVIKAVPPTGNGRVKTKTVVMVRTSSTP